MSDLKITPLWRVGSHRLFPTYQDAQDYVNQKLLNDLIVIAGLLSMIVQPQKGGTTDEYIREKN